MEPVRGRRVWTAATVDDATAWTTALGGESLEELEALAGGEDMDSPSLDRPWLPSCARELAPVREELDRGRGFAIVEPLDESRFGGGAVAAYWGLGRLLGRPFAQDVGGALLYDVRDTGRSVTDGARFSVTRAESTFHTDNAFNDELPDFVGLLCRRAALEGGRSQLINALALYNEVLATVDPETLHGDFWFDRRGQEGPGEPPIARRRLFTRDGAELSMRYMAYYIEVGQQRSGEPLSPAQDRLLEAVEQVLARPGMRVEFDLRPGQMLFTNNHWILHNRTAFTDHPEAADRRHYVRLWLRRE